MIRHAIVTTVGMVVVLSFGVGAMAGQEAPKATSGSMVSPAEKPARPKVTKPSSKPDKPVVAKDAKADKPDPAKDAKPGTPAAAKDGKPVAKVHKPGQHADKTVAKDAKPGGQK